MALIFHAHFVMHPQARARVVPILPVFKVCQSLAGYVREHLILLEVELESGCTYETLLQALELAGLHEPSYNALDHALVRARRRSREAAAPPGPVTVVLAPARTAVDRPRAQRVTLTPTRDLKAEDLF